MNRDSGASEAKTASKKRSSKFLPLLLVLLCAAAIGVGIRHYTGNKLPVGTWEVYFSEVDTGASHYSLEKRLIEKLTTAASRVNAALYHLDSARVADGLIKAHRRGVQVQVVTETDNIGEEAIAQLQEAGIPVAEDGDPDSYMHHKFIVIDEQYVWTGSYNTTYNGAYKNKNNVIFIDSAPLAYNFTREFRELFRQMRAEKPTGASVVHPKVTLSDGTQIFTYFSPDNDILSSLVKEIESAKKSIHFMAFSFTEDTLGSAMRDRFESGIDIQGVFEKRQISQYSEYEQMKAAGMSVIQDRNKGTMHHKVIVIDEETVITGSYNFSKNAEERNSENLLIIKGNPDIAQAYLAEFDRIVR
ncbi:MAG: phospholipase D-like domain-containing protein [Candidatus Poribacteria bacterium]|nr:phospholipase D-like domain-containing protein [Candidatus Poribacteria bacterium]